MAEPAKVKLSNTERLEKEPVLKLMFRLATPAIIGMAVQALYNVVDTVYVGHVSKTALSALSLAFPIQMFLIAVAVGTGVGANSLISRRLGEGKYKDANQVADHVFGLALVFAVVIGLIGFFFYDELVRIFTDDRRLIGSAGTYIRIIMMGSGAMFVPMITNNILRGEGNTFVPMLTMIIGAVINIGIDPLLIYGIGPFPEMGVAGAALATVIARAVSGVFILLVLFKGDHKVKLRIRELRLSFRLLGELYRVGVPAMIMQLLASVMIAGMNKIVVNYNVLAVAVVGVFFRLQSFILMPIFGLSQGYIPIVGYNFGQKNPDRMKKAMKIGAFVGFGFSFIGFVLFQFFPKSLFMLFNDDPELIGLGVAALRRISIAFPFIGPAIVGITTFQAVGRGLPSLIVSVLRQIVFLLPVMYLLGKIYGLPTLWLAFPISVLASVVLLGFWIRKVLKQVFEAVKQESALV